MSRYPASSGFSRPDATGEKPLRATVWFSIEHARARDAYVKRQIKSLPLDSRENLWLVRARPGFGWSWPKIMSCTTSPGSPKRLLNPNFSPKTPVKKGSTPSSSKYCLVCGIIPRIESFYTLSRLELIKNKKSVLEEFQATYNSTVLKNHETTASIKRLAKDSQQNRRTKRICVISNFDANEPGKKLYKNRFIRQQLLQNARGHWLLSSLIRGRERKLISWVHWFSAEWKHLWKQTRHKQGRNQGEVIYIKKVVHNFLYFT